MLARPIAEMGKVPTPLITSGALTRVILMTIRPTPKNWYLFTNLFKINWKGGLQIQLSLCYKTWEGLVMQLHILGLPCRLMQWRRFLQSIKWAKLLEEPLLNQWGKYCYSLCIRDQVPKISKTLQKIVQLRREAHLNFVTNHINLYCWPTVFQGSYIAIYPGWIQAWPVQPTPP